MNARHSRLLAAAILATWGGTLAFLCLSGRVASLLHPSFHVFAALAGIAFLGLAILLAATARPGAAPVLGGKSASAKIALAAVLIFPLLVALAGSGSGFGATTARNRGLVEDIAALPGYLPQPGTPVAEGTMMDTDLYLKKNASGQIVVETIDLLAAANEPTMREDFEDKDVEVVGQFLPAPEGQPTREFQIVRMFVICCAADARPVAITVRAEQTVSFPEMQWLKIAGRATFPLSGDRRTPLLTATSIEPIPQPENAIAH